VIVHRPGWVRSVLNCEESGMRISYVDWQISFAFKPDTIDEPSAARRRARGARARPRMARRRPRQRSPRAVLTLAAVAAFAES